MATDGTAIHGTLFGPLGRGYLFSRPILKQYLDEKKGEAIPDAGRRAGALKEWVDFLNSPAGKKATELALEHSFYQKVLVEALGYKMVPARDATAYTKPPSSITAIAGTPDVGLGSFPAGEPPSLMAVLELKPPGVGLDVPQAREGKKTPVEQAFEYAETILGVRWVLVSDMRVIRLYSRESPAEYVEVDLTACLDVIGSATDEFRKLIALFDCEHLIRGGTESATSSLLHKTTARQLQIREGFYEVYYRIRIDLYEAVAKATASWSPQPTIEELLEAVQRLLDRMLFLYYSEDHPEQLIPRATIKTLTESARKMPGASDHKVYDFLKALFREVNKGSPPASGVKIPGYDGELFKEHPIVDLIDLPDTLHDAMYEVVLEGGFTRRVQGVWGLHVSTSGRSSTSTC